MFYVSKGQKSFFVRTKTMQASAIPGFSENAPSAVMQEVFNASSAAFVIVDRKGLVSHANTAARNMLGKNISGKQWRSVIRDSFQPSGDDGNEVTLRDGRKVAVNTRPLSVGQLVELTDVTPTRKLQERISHMERLSSLGKMAASLAHQIRTPLSAAMLYAANLANRGLNEAVRTQFLKKLSDRLQDLENQVKDVLLFARAGDRIADRLELTELVSAVKNASEGVLSRGNARIDIRMDDPPMEIIANKTALASALNNLVANAVEAGATRIFIDVTRERGEAIIKIADNGSGMSPELQHSVFDPFFTTKANGTGLGLAVVKSVVAAHQGRIGLVSESGRGTCFSVVLPLADSGRAAGMPLAA